MQTREPWGFESEPYVVCRYEAQSLRINSGFFANQPSVVELLFWAAGVPQLQDENNDPPLQHSCRDKVKAQRSTPRPHSKTEAKVPEFGSGPRSIWARAGWTSGLQAFLPMCTCKDHATPTPVQAAGLRGCWRARCGAVSWGQPGSLVAG